MNVIPAKAGTGDERHSREGGDGGQTSFPRRRESRMNGIPAQAGIPFGNDGGRTNVIPAKAGMTGDAGMTVDVFNQKPR
jgi:hypothetical protein